MLLCNLKKFIEGILDYLAETNDNNKLYTMFRKVKIGPVKRSRKTLKSGWEYDAAYSKPFIKASKMLPEK